MTQTLVYGQQLAQRRENCRHFTSAAVVMPSLDLGMSNPFEGRTICLIVESLKPQRRLVQVEANTAKPIGRPSPRRIGGVSKRDELLPPISVAVNQLVSALSLTVSQAARIFGITRPTVYAWRRAEGHVKIEDTNQKRLVQIFGLFREWDRKSLGPLGERAHVPFLSDHRSIVDLLSGDLLDEATLAEVRNRLEFLAAKDREDLLVGEKAARWREAIGSEPLSGEALDSNLESNLRARKDVD